MWWAAASFLGLGRFTFPRDLVASAGMGAAYAFFLVCAVAYGSSLLILGLMRRHPGWTAIEIAAASLGWAGRIFESLMGAIMLLVLAEGYRLFVFLLHESTLPHTPGWALLVLAAVATAYGMAVGVLPVSRTLQFLVPLLAAISVVGFVPALANVRVAFLIPHWTGWRREITGVYRGSFILAGLQCLFIYSGFARQPGRLRREVLAGVTLNMAILAFVFVTTMGSFGADAMPLVSWPAPMIARAIDLHGFYLERIGYISMIAVIGAIVLFLIETTLVTAIAFTQTLALRPSSHTAVGYVVVAATAIGALFIPNVNVAEYIAVNIVSPLTLFMLVVKPVLLWAASKAFLRKTATSPP